MWPRPTVKRPFSPVAGEAWRGAARGTGWCRGPSLLQAAAAAGVGVAAAGCGWGVWILTAGTLLKSVAGGQGEEDDEDEEVVELEQEVLEWRAAQGGAVRARCTTVQGARTGGARLGPGWRCSARWCKQQNPTQLGAWCGLWDMSEPQS